eukprot:998589-Rhodomonas_salina.1
MDTLLTGTARGRALDPTCVCVSLGLGVGDSVFDSGSRCPGLWVLAFDSGGWAQGCGRRRV